MNIDPQFGLWVKNLLGENNVPFSIFDFMEEVKFNPEAKNYLDKLNLKHQEEKERGEVDLDNYYKRGFTTIPKIVVRYRITEDGKVIQCSVNDFNKWLETNPDLVLFEAGVGNTTITTSLVVRGAVNQPELDHLLTFETRIQEEGEEDKWSRTKTIEEAEERHKKAIEQVLRKKKAWNIFPELLPKEHIYVEESSSVSPSVSLLETPNHSYYNYLYERYDLYNTFPPVERLWEYLPQEIETQRLFESFVKMGKKTHKLHMFLYFVEILMQIVENAHLEQKTIVGDAYKLRRSK